MPKITNYTMEEKATKYSNLRKGAIHLTMEERANKWDEHVKNRSKYCKGYASRNPDKIKQISKDHYEVNKVQYNINSCIRMKENKQLYNQLQNIRRQKIRDFIKQEMTDPTDLGISTQQN